MTIGAVLRRRNLGDEMSKSIFIADTKYRDLTGTVSVDNSYVRRVIDHLIDIGEAKKDDEVVAVRIGSSSRSEEPVDWVSVVAYLSGPRAPSSNEPEEVRAVEIQVTPGEALAFFKRFDLVVKKDYVDLSATAVDGPHYE